MWIKVEDSLPQIGVKVLVYYKWIGEEKYSIAVDKMGIANVGANSPHWLGNRRGRITHWMPLPKRPGEEDGDPPS